MVQHNPPPVPGPAEAGAGHDVEVEWQFDALDLRPVERWLAALPVSATGGAGTARPAVTVLAQPARRLVDRYLDTEDWRIARSGFVLRTRRRGRRDEATLKDTRPATEGGLRRRLEVTEPLAAGAVERLGPDGPVGWRVNAVVGRRPLRQVLEVRTRRRPYSLRVGHDEVAELALDETTIDVGGSERPVQLRRVEVEVAAPWVDRLSPVVEDLRVACGLQPASLSKFEAGLMALGVTIPTLPDLGPTDADPESSFGQLGYAVVRRHLGVLLAKESGTRLGEDIEELHDMRVATRRLRAALDLFAEVFPVRSVTLRNELRWLAAVLGAVRDLDVQLERMDDPEWAAVAGAHDGGPSPLVELRRLLELERDQARRALLDALDSARYERLAAGLTSMVQHPPTRPTPTFRQPAVSAVPVLVTTRHRAVVRAARRAKRSGLAPDFHRLRIRGKRLRYSLEFTAALYGGRAERFVRSLARLQDGLGLMQDAEVATERLRTLATAPGSTLPPATVFAMGEVAERYRSEAEALLLAMPKRLKVLEAAEWQDLSAVMHRRREEALVVAPPRPVRRTATAGTARLAPTAGPLPDDPADPAADPAAGRAGDGEPAAGEPGVDEPGVDEPGVMVGVPDDRAFSVAPGPADDPTADGGAAFGPGRDAVVVPITGHDDHLPGGPGTASGNGRVAP